MFRTVPNSYFFFFLFAIGLLGEDEESTDLGALEKRLEEKKQQSRHGSTMTGSNPTSPSQPASSTHEAAVSPNSTATSHEGSKDREKDKDKKEKDDHANHATLSEVDEGEEDVANLSEMMCSLVTNHSGETRYLGK